MPLFGHWLTRSKTSFKNVHAINEFLFVFPSIDFKSSSVFGVERLSFWTPYSFFSLPVYIMLSFLRAHIHA